MLGHVILWLALLLRAAGALLCLDLLGCRCVQAGSLFHPSSALCNMLSICYNRVLISCNVNRRRHPGPKKSTQIPPQQVTTLREILEAAIYARDNAALLSLSQCMHTTSRDLNNNNTVAMEIRLPQWHDYTIMHHHYHRHRRHRRSRHHHHHHRWGRLA